MKQMDLILREIKEVMTRLDFQQINQMMDALQQAKRIFVLGEGRSGLQGKGFAMRLMHLGFPVYVIGESTTPSVNSGDTLVAISGSGTTSMIISLTKKAKANGVKIIGLTSSDTSKLAHLADHPVIIPGATKTGSGIHSIQLLSSLFDQTLHITLDYVCLELSQKKSVSNDQVNEQHSNME
ncbi:6-phospho 3-hexuloisomerase [Enterococcus sp. AZ067]|uniref:6-phospho-3-hexuloisomerase n=1 Tax=Enterococcus TaxID=1350 RepID=UPI0035D73122